ncbi:zinc finger protein [Coniochaeta ligniaria NRRL 30616]|uniref:Zinc finger protein n=1 Tax=Coniochaeta ligniaria NRRL 30616 TaxID=1408157 RepID=A0A1J7IZA0_9PEZI|nr:zinc finger protein [Coniochaeta ligniaria NRRL 30616]
MGIRNKKTLTKTRRHTRDIDQIKADLLSPKHLQQHKDGHEAEDLPAGGLHYCVECAKWFDAEVNLIGHRKGKPHRRRVKALSVEAYTQKEAEAARGIGSLDDTPKQTKEVEMS